VLQLKRDPEADYMSCAGHNQKGFYLSDQLLKLINNLLSF